MPESRPVPDAAERLTVRQKAALALMASTEQEAVVCSTETFMSSGQPWIHWRTVLGLWRRGLVVDEDGLAPDEWPEEPTVRLTAKGREIAAKYPVPSPARRTEEAVSETATSVWVERAEKLLEDALGRIDREDVIGTIAAAEACLRIDCGELPESELADYPFPDEDDDESGCTCPAELRERGGFTSKCSVHGL